MRKILLLLAATCTLSSMAQLSGKLKDGLKWYFDPADSAKHIKFHMNSQIWARYNENAPGTVVQGTPESNTADLSIRRIRFVLSGQLTDRVTFFMQFGQNNLNYLSARKAGAFFHDVTTDYAFIKKKLSIGFGLNGWNGPSRFSNISTASIMPLDPPNYQEVTNDTYDQFVRRLGIYAKGKLGKLDYRISAGKPFVIQTTSVDPLNQYASFSTKPPKFVYQGYFMYQFLDQESNFAPSTTGTYQGSKRVFNIGAGFYQQTNGMFYKGTAGDTVKQDIMLYAIDIFYDAPINKEKGTAISLYGCYSNYNYGNKFLKVTGPDNLTSASSNTTSLLTKATYGNAFPYLGTGDIFYAQAGYKLKNNALGTFGTLQFFVDGQYANYKRLPEAMFVGDVGVNWLLNGQNAKFTLNYQNRPYFTENAAGKVTQGKRLSCLVLQYQVMF